MIWEDSKNGAYKEIKLAKLGQERFQALEWRARSSIKFGAWEQERKLEQLTEEMR